MNEYRLERPWVGKGLAGFFGVLVVMGSFLGISYEGKWGRNLLACAPAIVLAAVGVTAMWRNKRTVVVGREGIRITTGPMPAIAVEWTVKREEILAVQVRTFAVQGKHGGRFRTVGVEMRDGNTLELVSSCPPHPGMVEEAKKIAAALGWAERVTELDRRPPMRFQWVVFWPLARFLGLVALCAMWGNWVMGR